VIAVLGSVGYYLTYDMGADDAVQATVDRVFVVPQQVVDWFLYVYPRMIDFNHGLGIGLVAKIFGTRDYVNPPFAVCGIITGDPRGSANGVWSTEFWAMFGYPGVIIGSAAVGALMVLLDRWCLERPRTATAAALYAYLIGATLTVPSMSIFTALLSGGLGSAPIFIWFFLEQRTTRVYRSVPKHA